MAPHCWTRLPLGKDWKRRTYQSHTSDRTGPDAGEQELGVVGCDRQTPASFSVRNIQSSRAVTGYRYWGLNLTLSAMIGSTNLRCQEQTNARTSMYCTGEFGVESADRTARRADEGVRAWGTGARTPYPPGTGQGKEQGRLLKEHTPTGNEPWEPRKYYSMTP